MEHDGLFTCGPTLGREDTVRVHVIDGKIFLKKTRKEKSQQINYNKYRFPIKPLLEIYTKKTSTFDRNYNTKLPIKTPLKNFQKEVFDKKFSKKEFITQTHVTKKT